MTVAAIFEILEAATDLEDYEAIVFVASRAPTPENGKTVVSHFYTGSNRAISGLLTGESDAFRAIVARGTLSGLQVALEKTKEAGDANKD